AAASGTELEITARGPEADQALDALVRLVEGGFESG
ncbi:MAG: HPr family phosphocarrier protein, partial [Alphaproteobacteria bacterium]